MACDHRQWILGSSFCPFRPPSFISYIQISPKIWVRQLGWLFPIANKWKVIKFHGNQLMLETCWSPGTHRLMWKPCTAHPRPPPWLCASSHVSFRSRPWCWPGTRELWGFNHIQPFQIGIECNFHEIFVDGCMYACMYVWMDRWYGWMYVCMYVWMRTYVRMYVSNIYIYRNMYIYTMIGHDLTTYLRFGCIWIWCIPPVASLWGSSWSIDGFGDTHTLEWELIGSWWGCWDMIKCKTNI